MASAVILLPFYIHYLTTETFGAFSILLAFSMLVQIVVTFSFDSSIYVHFHEYKHDPRKLSRFISSSFLFIVLIGICVALVLLATGHYAVSLIFKAGEISFYPYGLMAVFTGIFQAFFKVYNSLLQTQQKPTLFFRSNLLSFSLIAAGTILGLHLAPNSLLGPMGARLASAAVCGAWAFFRMAREFGFHFDYPLLRATFAFNFYSFIYQLQQWFMSYFDRILLSFFLPLADVGVYGFLMSCLVAIEFILNGLYNSFSPKVVALVTDQKQKGTTIELNRYYNGLTAIGMILVAGVVLTFPWLIENLISKPDYQKAVPYIPYAALIYLFRPMRLYFGIPFGILKYTKPLPVIYTFVAGLKIIVLIVLTRPLGLYGVIIASLASYWLEIVILYYAGKDRFAFSFNAFKLLIAPVSLVVMIVIMEPLIGNRLPLTLHAFYLLACLLLLGFAYKNEARLIDPLKILRNNR